MILFAIPMLFFCSIVIWMKFFGYEYFYHDEQVLSESKEEVTPVAATQESEKEKVLVAALIRNNKV